MRFPTTSIFAISLSILALACALPASASALAGGVLTSGPGGGLQPRQPVIKPEHTIVNPAAHEQHVILVKFTDDLPVRLRGGQLTDGNTGVLAEAEPTLAHVARGGVWQRLAPEAPEDRLDAMRHIAQQNLGRAVADMNTYFHLFLAPNIDAAAAIDALNALPIVELAEPVPLPPPPPLPPDFEPDQGYLQAATDGVDAYFSWNQLGTAGAGVSIVDIEYSFNANHQDLPAVTVVGPTPGDPFNDNSHGTAVLGILGSVDNAWGTTGIAPQSDLLFAGAYTNGVWNVAGAITEATNVLSAGDIILIEQQLFGPNHVNNNPAGPCAGQDPQCGMVPMEWQLASYNAIVTAVGNGIIIVAAAGNGSQDLDDPIYSQGNNGHWPFLPQNDSGAIIVGAGHAPGSFGGTGVDRSRLGFSNFGSRVNLQGWGEAIWTTGYGNAYDQDGPNLFYTHSFAGTSGASPMIVGACALLQSAHVQQYAALIDPWDMRQALMATGSPQKSGQFPDWQNIGPRPDVAAAAAWWNLGPQTIHVPADFPTIQQAINAANNGSEIIVAPGSYNEQITFLGKAIHVRSSQGPAVTTIDAQGAGTVVNFSSTDTQNTILEGFTITGGNGGDLGGGMRIAQISSPTVIDCTFHANTANSGGGVQVLGNASSAEVTITNCRFLANTAGVGGGMYAIGRVVHLIDCEFDSNTASNNAGGGLYFSKAGIAPPYITATDCRFADNSAATGGGGVTLGGATNTDSVFTNCLFEGNVSCTGGGLQTVGTGTSTVLVNCTFVDNTADESCGAGGVGGGGIYNFSSNPTITGCAFQSNSAVTSGGAIYNTGGGTSSIGTSLFCENTPSDILGNWNDQGGNQFPVNCPGNCFGDLNGSGSVGVPDLLVLLANWGPCPAPCPADLTGSGSVGVPDLLALLSAWGPCP